MAQAAGWKVVMIADATDDDFTPIAPILGLLSEAGRASRAVERRSPRGCGG